MRLIACTIAIAIGFSFAVGLPHQLVASNCIEYRLGSSLFACCNNSAADNYKTTTVIDDDDGDNGECSTSIHGFSRLTRTEPKNFCKIDNWKSNLPSKSFYCGNCSTQKACNTIATKSQPENSKKWMLLFKSCCNSSAYKAVLNQNPVNTAENALQSIKIELVKREGTCSNCTACNDDISNGTRANLNCHGGGQVAISTTDISASGDFNLSGNDLSTTQLTIMIVAIVIIVLACLICVCCCGIAGFYFWSKSQSGEYKA